MHIREQRLAMYILGGLAGLNVGIFINSILVVNLGLWSLFSLFPFALPAIGFVYGGRLAIRHLSFQGIYCTLAACIILAMFTVPSKQVPRLAAEAPLKTILETIPSHPNAILVKERTSGVGESGPYAIRIVNYSPVATGKEITSFYNEAAQENDWTLLDKWSNSIIEFVKDKYRIKISSYCIRKRNDPPIEDCLGGDYKIYKSYIEIGLDSHYW